MAEQIEHSNHVETIKISHLQDIDENHTLSAGRKIFIKVPKAEVIHHNGEKVTVYHVQSWVIGGHQERGEVQRRFSDFKKLNDKLVKTFGKKVIPEFLVPRNKWFEDHFAAQFIENRRLLVEDWLQVACNVEGVNVETVVEEFLSLKQASKVYESKTSFGGRDILPTNSNTINTDTLLRINSAGIEPSTPSYTRETSADPLVFNIMSASFANDDEL